MLFSSKCLILSSVCYHVLLDFVFLFLGVILIFSVKHFAHLFDNYIKCIIIIIIEQKLSRNEKCPGFFLTYRVIFNPGSLLEGSRRVFHFSN